MALKDCRIVGFPKINDPRGNLTFIEGGNHLDYDIKRVYYIYDVPGGAERGGHAHKQTQELLVAMSGSFDVVLNDGMVEQKFHLNRSHYGLYVPPMTWRHLENFSSGSVCMVLASERYTEEDYFRAYADFEQALRDEQAPPLRAAA
ncbi:MAG TPA: FdtA/QdtA family cupin domain-containing protein [Baekduia sp.]|nr:FdtA/QdtA family cupin domain-containing protein [Baekduia sp.]